MSEADLFFNNYIQKSIFPGISLLKGNFSTDSEFSYSTGCLSYDQNSPEVNPETVYDTASLTKPLITSLLTLILVKNRVLSLEDEIKKFFPELNFPVTITHLLTHSSGLPSWFPFYIYPYDLKTSFQKLISLQSSPGQEASYSCVGYILLKLIIEEVTSDNFENLVKQEIFNPLNLKVSSLGKSVSLNTAPTEKGNMFEKKMSIEKDEAAASSFNWRTETICGEVNDLNSYHFGGSAGNSGLFSNPSELRVLLSQYIPGVSQLLNDKDIAAASSPLILDKSAAFHINTDRKGSCGSHLSERAAGHTGFTGTSAWLDYKTMDYFIILTNRIHPVVADINFSDIRREIHNYLALNY